MNSDKPNTACFKCCSDANSGCEGSVNNSNSPSARQHTDISSRITLVIMLHAGSLVSLVFFLLAGSFSLKTSSQDWFTIKAITALISAAIAYSIHIAIARKLWQLSADRNSK